MLKLSFETSCNVTFAAMRQKPSLHTLLSPRLLDLYDVENSIVVIIDVFRATSTIATALYNGAEKIIPVAGVEDCISVSYTHLRAHETPEHLVCRLLLEKK